LPSHTYSLPGTYSVTLVASNDNCSDTLVYEVNPDNAGLSDDLMSLVNLNLYPNPTNENSTLLIDNKVDLSSLSIQINDLTGRLVYMKILNSLSSGLHYFELPVASFDSGQYMLTLLDANASVKKVLKLVKSN
jgi:hypothetical protein